MLKISLVVTCFNHEKYIDFHINSILEQHYDNIEIIFVDDCSSDKTVEKIKKYNDNRIKLIEHPYNMGINASMRDGINAAKGDIIVLSSGDDAEKKDFLHELNAIYSENPKINVVYPSMELMDENGKLLNEVRHIKLKDKYEILHKIFFDYNPLFSPEMSFRTSAIRDKLFLPNSVANHQDCLIHIDILLNCDNENIYYLDKPLVKYRVPNSHSGISLRSVATENRENLETDYVLNEFLKIKNPEIFTKIFKNEIPDNIEITDKVIPYWLGHIALKSSSDVRKQWGYKRVIKFLETQENFDLVHKLYGFEFKNLLSLTNFFNETELMKINKKTKKYKRLFNISLFFILLLVLCIICCIYIIKFT